MRALTIEPGHAGRARVQDVPDATPTPEQYLVQVLETGICGTDREIAAGAYGEAPAGCDYLVLGHESLGRVIGVAQESASFRAGDLVVCMVRRPCPEHCRPCRMGVPDYCETGHYRERGIRGLNGFCAERYVERPEYLVRVPESLRDVAVLLEPLSIVEKAFREAQQLQQRLPWQGRRAVIAGAGPVGLLAALVARLRGFETLVYSRAPDAGVRGEIYRAGDVACADADASDLPGALHDFGAPDLFIEATGYSPLALDGAQQLALNGVAALLSVTGGDAHHDVATDRLNLRMVLGNRIVFGSVSAQRCDFEQGVRDLAAAEAQWPGLVQQLITARVPLADAPGALAAKAPGAIKTVIEVAGG